MNKIFQIYGDVLNNGPGKVLKNTMLGLDELNIPYTFNEPPIEGSYKISLTPNPIMDSSFIGELLVGPNVCVLPFENGKIMEMNYKKCVVPSEWVYNKYKKWISEDKLSIWPVGIDTNLFKDTLNYKKNNDCLIYFKRRNGFDLETIKNFLKSKNQTYKIISYGSYNESDFINLLSESRYCIMIDSTESQGIAVGEIMSSNLPILVWDVSEWADYGEQFKVPASSVPYWDNSCGEKFYSVSSLNETFTKFMENLHLYQPRKFVLNNLSLSKQVKELINIFESK
jgi:hypothetical protein